MFTVTTRTASGESVVRCAGHHEAAQFALTLACDGWTARIDADTLLWIDDPANFDPENAATIRRAQA